MQGRNGSASVVASSGSRSTRWLAPRGASSRVISPPWRQLRHSRSGSLEPGPRNRSMRLTKMGHACVRLEKDGRILVIDPGTLTEPEALDGAEAVLITHEHPDHVDMDRFRIAAERTPHLEIWTTSALAAQLEGNGADVPAVRTGRS